MQSKTKIQKKTDWNGFFRILKWMVPLIIFIVIYKKVYQDKNLSLAVLGQFMKEMDWYWYPLLLVFSALNWSVEVRKWQYLICKLELQSFVTASKSVLCGVAVSQLLPFRTGESLGRLAYVKNENKISAALLSVAGSFTQLMMTIFFGCISFLIIEPLGKPPWQLLLTLVLLALMVLLAYSRLPRLTVLGKNRFFRAIRDAYSHLNRKDMARLFLFSALRYVLFVLPYALLAGYFQVASESGFLYLCMAVSCIFLFQTISPGFLFTDMMIRISVPVLIFTGSLDQYNVTAHLPGLIIYIFNVLLPTCLGAIVLLSLKLKRK